MSYLLRIFKEGIKTLLHQSIKFNASYPWPQVAYKLPYLTRPRVKL